MEIAVKIAALAVLAAVFCLILRQRETALALGLSVLACVAVLVLGLKFLQPVWSVAEQLERLSGLEDGIMTPLLKVVGIGILTQIASGICTDAGESAIAKAVELTGSIMAVYVSLPLLSAVLDLVEKFLGGAA